MEFTVGIHHLWGRPILIYMHVLALASRIAIMTCRYGLKRNILLRAELLIAYKKQLKEAETMY